MFSNQVIREPYVNMFSDNKNYCIYNTIIVRNIIYYSNDNINDELTFLSAFSFVQCNSPCRTSLSTANVSGQVA